MPRRHHARLRQVLEAHRGVARQIKGRDLAAVIGINDPTGSAIRVLVNQLEPEINTNALHAALATLLVSICLKPRAEGPRCLAAGLGLQHGSDPARSGDPIGSVNLDAGRGGYFTVETSER